MWKVYPSFFSNGEEVIEMETLSFVLINEKRTVANAYMKKYT